MVCRHAVMTTPGRIGIPGPDMNRVKSISFKGQPHESSRVPTTGHWSGALVLRYIWAHSRITVVCLVAQDFDGSEIWQETSYSFRVCSDRGT